MDGIQRAMDQFGWTICDLTVGEIVAYQTGVFRTNCLDW
jgi:hypothetical protein